MRSERAFFHNKIGPVGVAAGAAVACLAFLRFLGKLAEGALVLASVDPVFWALLAVLAGALAAALILEPRSLTNFFYQSAAALLVALLACATINEIPFDAFKAGVGEKPGVLAQVFVALAVHGLGLRLLWWAPARMLLLSALAFDVLYIVAARVQATDLSMMTILTVPAMVLGAVLLLQGAATIHARGRVV